ncbi:hypothetical protein V6Z11_A03G101900 [Gossypium hirsutum]
MILLCHRHSQLRWEGAIASAGGAKVGFAYSLSWLVSIITDSVFSSSFYGLFVAFSSMVGCVGVGLVSSTSASSSFSSSTSKSSSLGKLGNTNIGRVKII